MTDLKKYKKNQAKETEFKVSSVNITKEQSDFVNENNLNLSMLVRDHLEELRNQSSPKKRK